MDQASPERLTLFNPADYFTFVLDQEIRAAGMPGGYCGFALELAAPPDLARLRERLAQLAERFPVATARLERLGKRYGWRPTGQTLELDCHACPPGEAPEALARRWATDLVSRPAALATDPPLSAHRLTHGAGGTFLLRWVHPLLDARGVKIVLDFLNSDDPARFRESPPLIPQKLAEWGFWKSARLALKAKRHNGQGNRLDSCLPTVAGSGPQSLRLWVRRYSPEESAQIAKLAQRHTGLAGKSLYYLGCLMRAMEQAGPPAAKAGYCFPYAFNLRRQNAPTPVFGNHVGCLFAQATREQVQGRDGLFAHLLAQHQRAVREELDFAYLPLMWLGQWLSPGRYAKLLRTQRSGGELSSGWFSDIGEVRFGKDGFLGVRPVGMYHLTWMTLPPGLALLAGQMDGRLTLSYNALCPAVEEAWLERVMGIMDRELLGRDG
jgi:hypothetical protein